MKALSVLIPARNEEFLGRTIQDILENIEADTEIIAILDGYLPDPPLVTDERLTVIYHPESVGQRAGTNDAAKLAQGKYLMKVDAHCSFDKGFDRKMLEAFKETGDNVTMLPLMKNLHAFDWVCKNGHRRYQSPSGPCETCKEPTTKDVVWIAKNSPQSISYRFDKNMHFQYYGEFTRRSECRFGLITGYKLSIDTRSVPVGIIDLLTDLANSHQLTCSRNLSWFRKNVSSNAVSFPSIDDSGSIGADKVIGIGNQSQVGGVATPSVVTNVVDNGNVLTSTSGNSINEPSIDDSVCECFLSETSASSVSVLVNSSNPVPATGSTINSNLIEKFNNILGGKFVYSEKTKSFHNGSVTISLVINKDINESMSIQGSCFMCTKEKYFELDLCGEEFHSWGQQGVEVACKTWLSGGRVIVNKRTWYSHMFRTRGGDFGFPYHNPQSKVEENREKTKRIFRDDNWPKAIHKFQWLMDKFNPPEWTINKGMIYYTHNQLDEKIAKPVRDQLQKISDEKRILIVSSSLKKMDFGVRNVRFPHLERGYVSMFKQILGALENSSADIIFFTEHDVLYHPSHFEFTPPDKNTFYYNQNVWLLNVTNGHALHYDVNQLSGLCVYKDAAVTHFRERYERVEKEGFTRNMGFEPFTHHRVTWKNEYKFSTWKSEFPNIDIKHGENATGQRWRKDQYRNQHLLINWQESENYSIPGWKTTDLIALK